MVTTTGSGQVVPDSVSAFEYLTAGDSAIVAIQYSYLPSWLSYAVDQERAREAGRELFDAVYEQWSALPADDRPRLLVFGESLGSFGGETAFSGEYDMASRVDGALFAGPPNFNTLYREFADDRDDGSPEIEPIFHNGRTVRFAARPGREIAPASQPWNRSRVLYLVHPSDPVVWWSPALLLTRPDWLEEPAGDDVLDAMVWIPFITFWQVTADLPIALGGAERARAQLQRRPRRRLGDGAGAARMECRTSHRASPDRHSRRLTRHRRMAGGDQLNPYYPQRMRRTTTS